LDQTPGTAAPLQGRRGRVQDGVVVHLVAPEEYRAHPGRCRLQLLGRDKFDWWQFNAGLACLGVPSEYRLDLFLRELPQVPDVPGQRMVLNDARPQDEPL